MIGEKVINVVPKWLNPYIKLEIINVDQYVTTKQDTDDVENENRSNQAFEDLTNKFLRVVLKRTMIFECKTCYSCFTTQRDYKLHVLKHAKPNVDSKYSNQKYGNYVKKYKCQQCDLRFVAESTLKAHAEAHRPFPHVCHCGVGFYKHRDLLAHKRLVHPDIQEDDWQPKTTYSGKKPKSEFCIKSEYATPKSKANKIKLKISNPKPKLKDQIKKPNSKQNVIKLPQVICETIKVDGKNKYVCPECNKHYASYVGLKIHFFIHKGEKPYKCDICSKGFNQGGALALHKQRHAGVTFECPVCKKGLASKGVLPLHMRVHTGVKPYDCEFCGKAFSDPSAFARHIRTHTGDKRYQCPLCPMRFSDASGLIQHRNRHAGVKNHKCEICEKKFYTKWDLSQHLILHSGRYSYECDDCGRRYATKNYLHLHIIKAKVHSKVKCELCPRVFKTAYLRERHENVHKRLELADYECDRCGETFCSETTIAKHLRLDH